MYEVTAIDAAPQETRYSTESFSRNADGNNSPALIESSLSSLLVPSLSEKQPRAEK